MTDLSPAAQAVLDAFLKTPGEVPMPGWNYGRDLAAALRAAADQVVPEECLDRFPNDSEWQDGFTDANERIRAELLAIAAELEVAGAE